MDRAALHLEPLELALAPEPLAVQARSLPAFERSLQVKVREAKLLASVPWVRKLGNLDFTISTEGWKFPTPLDMSAAPAAEPRPPREAAAAEQPKGAQSRTRLQPPRLPSPQEATV